MYNTLFKDIEDLRTVLPQIQSSSDESDILPFVEQAAVEFIQPFLSAAYYTELKDALIAANYVLTDLTAAQQAVISHLRRSEANYGFYRALPAMLAVIGGGSFKESTNQNTQGARQWVHRENKANYIATADLFMDLALEVLEKTPASYTTWSGSEAFTVHQSLLLSSVADFVGIGKSRRTFLKLKNYIKMAEDRHIVPAISRQLLAALIVKKQAGTAFTSHETIVVDYLFQAISNFALFMGAPELMLDISADGIRVVSTADGIVSKTTTDRMLYNDWLKRIDGNGRHYLALVKKYLDENVAEFADYTVEAQEKDSPSIYGSDAISGTTGSLMI
jgi:hypothetical protein